MQIVKEYFGQTPDGKDAFVYKLENSSGAYIIVTDFGAALVQAVVPDKNGKLLDVVLGYDTLDGYLQNHCYFGGTIGRNSNRLENAVFAIDGRDYHLTPNEGKNNLHSGPVCYNQMLWKITDASADENSITFGRISPDKEQGFPGNLNVSVQYTFTDDCTIRIEYTAVSDADTLVNLTNHSYFNLNGADSGSVLGQELRIGADAFTPFKDSSSIPTGELRPVEGTPMDFRKAKPIGRDIEAEDEQIRFGDGYDHNFILNDYEKGCLRTVASAYAPESGIAMDVMTDLPGVQFYSGNFIEHVPGKGGHFYEKRDGFCLETQYYPNAVHMKGVPSPIHRAGTFYESRTLYHFYVK